MIRTAAFLLLATPLVAQSPAPGHRLYSPRGQTETYLVDTAGEIVHTWPSAYTPGQAVHLQEDGKLLRGITTGAAPPPGLNGGGGGVELLAFDGTQLWEFRYDSRGVFQHHDVEPMPNGDVLMIAWDTKSRGQTIKAGRDPALTPDVSYPDHLIQVRPSTGEIVWEWHAWDHLIQDFDPKRANYGVVADHPERIDVNYPPVLIGELHHVNSVDYDPINDLIVISVPFYNEIWVIDHSTTTEEAAGSTGGNHGKGGDLLYRWGNPEAYGRGTPADQQLFFQHSAEFIPPGFPGAGNVTVFNNQVPTGSTVDELVLPLDANGFFVLPPGGTYGPDAPVWSYADPAFNSMFMSSAQRLSNGNTLICSSLQGRLFEVETDGTIVWEHTVTGGAPTATFVVTYVDRTAWISDETMLAEVGGTVQLDVVAGSQMAGRSYLLLGSEEGTNPGLTYQGVHVPLTPDAYFRFLLGAPAGSYFTGNVGTLDASGHATATINVPPGAALPGSVFDHAFAVFQGNTLLGSTNAVRTDVLP